MPMHAHNMFCSWCGQSTHSFYPNARRNSATLKIPLYVRGWLRGELRICSKCWNGFRCSKDGKRLIEILLTNNKTWWQNDGERQAEEVLKGICERVERSPISVSKEVLR